MLYVKSCYHKDNPIRSGTIKIGSLHEYREIEDAQIADKHEGNIEIILKLDDMHLDIAEFQEFLDSHNSYAEFVPIGPINTGGPSDALPGKRHIPHFHAKSTLSKNNGFIFCLSDVESQKDSEEIFNEYDDNWSFSKSKIEAFALGLAESLAIQVWNERHAVFPKHELTKNFEVCAYWNNINYVERKIVVDNFQYATNRKKLVEMVRNPGFIKPKSFSPEREFRICFDIYDNGMLLHPVKKHIIISAERVLHLINK
ncbi:hypothetical protein [Enterobacter sp.]|uniref:hypothetical protein n=1 Tax=Enterobacter sp. TaxID=42895 RepID=UPI00296EF674|nr:hypothetical protein [Enterobacter sp.]